MTHRTANHGPAMKTRPRVFRGDACAVDDAVRHEANGGFVIPHGPYRYPYAAVLELLKVFGHRRTHHAETHTDPVLCRDTLSHELASLLRLPKVIGIPGADRLDSASAELLSAFIGTCQFVGSYGIDVPQFVFGCVATPVDALRIEDAEIVDVSSAKPCPMPVLSSDAESVYALVRCAPHPVAEDGLRRLSELSLEDLRAALTELASAKLIVAADRIGLGALSDASEHGAQVWLTTTETRLPHARLGCAKLLEPELALQLARAALSRNEFMAAKACIETAGLTDSIEFAHALALGGWHEAAKGILDDLSEQSGGPVAAVLALSGSYEIKRADEMLRQEQTIETAIWRARLAITEGRFGAAINLLRRISRRELEETEPAVQVLYLLTLAECRIATRDKRSARRALDDAKSMCASDSDRGAWHALWVAAAEDDAAAEAVTLGLEDALQRLDVQSAEAFAARLGTTEVRDVVSRLQVPSAITTDTTTLPETCTELFVWLRTRGATLLAVLSGEEVEIQPPGAAALPGLQSKLEAALQRMREYPSAVLIHAKDFAFAGPYCGDTVLALQSLGSMGPVLVFLRSAAVVDEENLLSELHARSCND